MGKSRSQFRNNRDIEELVYGGEASEAQKPDAAAETLTDAEETPEPKPQKESEPRTYVGVRFRTAGKVYYFSPGDLPVKRGSHIIVETSRGVEYGTAVSAPMELEDRKYNAPLKQIMRIATPEDEAKVRANREREREAKRVCQERIRSRGLDMKLIDAEYTFDSSKILFYFTADGRVDFRDLVKDLAGVFRTRIELRQIGVRDETKILGGYGSCGRPLCCHSYLSDFIPVSIKMAKEQNLSLNPAKISGVCGRLMCCLKNEEDTYEELNKNLPRVGDEVEGNDGLRGEVQSVNVLRQSARVLVEEDDEKEIHEYGAGELTILHRRRRGSSRKKQSGKASSSETREMKELEQLEAGEKRSEEPSGEDKHSEERRGDSARRRGDGRGRANRRSQESEGGSKQNAEEQRPSGEGRKRRRRKSHDRAAGQDAQGSQSGQE